MKIAAKIFARVLQLFEDLIEDFEFTRIFEGNSLYDILRSLLNIVMSHSCSFRWNFLLKSYMKSNSGRVCSIALSHFKSEETINSF